MRRCGLVILLFLCTLTGLLSAQTPQSDIRTVSTFQPAKDSRFYTYNNSIVLLPSGRAKFTDMFRVLHQAKHTIHMEYFNFRNDSISNELFQILIERAKAGVKVRIVFDGFGNSSNNRPLRRRHLRALRDAGIEIYEFDPIRFPWVNHVAHRDHRKIVVVDGMIGYTGGMNVADYYIKGKPEFGDWRDMHLRVEGLAVNELQKIFVRMWQRVTGQQISTPALYHGETDVTRFFPNVAQDSTPTAGKKKVAVVNREPHTSPKVIRHTFVDLINSATRYLQIVSPYFTLRPCISKAIKRALKRGVKVEIMVSAKSDINITPRAVEYSVHDLMKSGADIYFYEGGFHHSKIMMVDSSYCFVGSANMDSRSMAWDYECNLLILDPYITRQLNTIFNRDKLKRCFKLTEQRWKEMPAKHRRRAWLCHLLAPLL